MAQKYVVIVEVHGGNPSRTIESNTIGPYYSLREAETDLARFLSPSRVCWIDSLIPPEEFKNGNADLS